MEVGVFLGTQHPASADIRREFDNHVEQVRALRDGGYDAVWIGQHYLTYPNQFLQLTPMLARLAAETGDMKIGSNILVLPLHNIIDIAEQYATLDIIANGRLILGVALGYRDEEYHAFGVDRKTRARRFEEQIEALKLIWEEDSATFEGKYVRFKNISIRPKPLQKPRPPIWIGAAADAAIKRAARMGDQFIATSVTTVSAMRPQIDLYNNTLKEVGKPVRGFAKCVELYVGKTREEARVEGAPYIAEKYRAYYAWGMGDNVPGESGKDLDVDALIKDRFIVGDPEDCIRDCIEQRDKLGIEHLLVRFNFPGMSQKSVMKCIRLFAQEVMPHIR